MWIFVLLLILFYTAFLSLLAAGIIKLYQGNKKYQPPNTPEQVDVVIPFRDEVNNINKLLHDLLNQTYPSSLFHVIFIDDHSTDGGDKIINETINKHHLNATLLHLSPDKKGKKEALLTGIEYSNNKYILTTDADCAMFPNWVNCMITQAMYNHADLLLGPVIHTGKSVVGRLQSVESLSLLAVTMGTAGLGIPVLSNAANMAINRNTLNTLQDPFKNSVSSGDDIFLMETLKTNKATIAFNPEQEALVKTKASESWNKLIQQRARWMSKTKHYRFGSSKLTMIIFGIIQIGFLISIPVLIVNQAFLSLLFLWIFKILYDNLLMYLVSSKYSVPFRLTESIVFSALYPFWTLTTNLFAYFTKSTWKGRPVS
ncbi:MAG: glycosyltransferase [Bacteroidota bacterium]|nr:glycosyltransferase [Bacteroidota bacterium]